MRPSISICIIAYQSEETLPRTLASAAWADEVLVLVDAKSTDATEADPGQLRRTIGFSAAPGILRFVRPLTPKRDPVRYRGYE